MKKIIISITLTIFLFVGCGKQTTRNSNNSSVQNAPKRIVPSSGKEVTFYPTYGHLQEDEWVIPLRGWVHENRKSLGHVVTALATLKGSCKGQSMELFNSRSDAFLSDDKSREEIIIEFDSDPDQQQYSFEHSSNQNGIVEKILRLPKERINRIWQAQKSPNKWGTFHAVSKDYVGVGRIRLIEPEGISVVSDIDDTIKISEIPSGQRKVFDYTFCREFEAAPDMTKMYNDWVDPTLHPDWTDVTFHYVSGGPQQLFGPLYDFLITGQGGFPEGTFHLRFFPKNLLEEETRVNLKRFAAGSMETTFQHKVEQITRLIETFPRRKFILVGDSGEVDPEVYKEIRDKYPAQVMEIWIRDVVDDARDNSYRLTDMHIIPAGKTVCMEEDHHRKLSRIVERVYPPRKYQKSVAKSCDL